VRLKLHVPRVTACNHVVHTLMGLVQCPYFYEDPCFGPGGLDPSLVQEPESVARESGANEGEPQTHP
jgi:hypothetical protein